MKDQYDVILADPPWKYYVYDKDTGQGRSAESHYSTMELKDLLTLKINGKLIKDYRADNCALFLWITWPGLFDYGQSIFDAWGFKYRTLGFEWWKLNKRWYTKLPPYLSPTLQDLYRLFKVGMGYYARSNSEPCLLGVKGQMSVATKDQRNYIIAPIREHSRKPDEQYQIIEALYPNMRYLELFSRNTREGWDCWGNETGKFDD